ncbi:MAG: rod-binding protein [Lachnospiraceae bacterium]|nr:rod-binding protein [Lachnospiraceae bacterium]MBP5762428.1 rod-binding protein [Lachnospiraceae bacterium]
MDMSGISNLTDYYTSVTGQAKATELANSLSNKAEHAKTDDELMSVCKQFESYLLEQVFKNMDKTVIRNGDESKDSSTENLVDYFKGQALQELSAQSTEKQGLGIAQQLYEQLRRNYGLDENSIPADQVVSMNARKN